MDTKSSLHAEHVELQAEVNRLADQHERLRIERGEAFDWKAHRRHRDDLMRLISRIRDYRHRLHDFLQSPYGPPAS